MFISSNPPLIPGICTVAPTSTMVRLRLQRAATKSSCPTKRGTKEVQPGTKQGQAGTKQGQPGTKQGQPGTKQGQPGTKKDKGIIGQTPYTGVGFSLKSGYKKIVLTQELVLVLNQVSQKYCSQQFFLYFWQR